MQIERPNVNYIAGVDEVGRGPLVGDVVTAAVILDPNKPIAGLADSKKLSDKKRQLLAAEIKEPLLTRKGVMAAIIKLVEFIEHAQWDKTNIVMEKLKLDKEQAVKHYNEALAWADEQSQLAG